MDFKLIVILLAVLGTLYTLMLNIVRYFSLNNPTPENLKDVYDAETYEKWRKYSREHSKLEIFSTVITCAITIALLAANVYSAFAALFPKGWFMQLFSVILLENIISAIVGTVESYISTMKIEQKYGFNRSTLKTFVKDRIRGFLVGILVSLILTVLIAVCHNWLGVWMIPAFAAVAFVFTLVISFIYPYLSRIGNKFTPLEEGDLKDSLMKLLEKYGYKVKAIEVMDASRRTTKLNAYFTGFGKLKTIVLYDNLINAMTPEEITAVFAHELGHGLHKDVQKSQMINIFNLLLMAAIAWGFAGLTALYADFGFADSVNYGFTYIVLGVALGVLQPLTGLIMNAHSRKAEYRADRQAVVEGYGDAMISAFKKLARDNFAHLSPSAINIVLEYSHPPLDCRVKNVEKCMKEISK